MRVQTVFAAASALALAACSADGPVEDTSDAAQMEDAMDQLAKPQPGQYRTTSELVNFEMPGVPEDDAKIMRGLMEMGATQEQTMCITQEMVDEGHQEYLSQLQGFKDECEYKSFDTSGGKLVAELECSDPSGGNGKITFDGTVGETEQDMTVVMDMADPSSGQGMKMTLKSTTTRLGDCPG